MMKHHFLGLLVLFAAATGAAGAADGWVNLKLGMTEEEAEVVLGAPLLRSEGRGFELWTYDNRAEVIFYGGIIAWTAPATKNGPQRVVENWQFNQGSAERIRLPLPPRRKSPASNTSNTGGTSNAKPADGYAFRYRQN